MQTVKQLCDHLIEFHGKKSKVVKFYVKVELKKHWQATQNPMWPKEEPPNQKKIKPVS